MYFVKKIGPNYSFLLITFLNDFLDGVFIILSAPQNYNWQFIPPHCFTVHIFANFNADYLPSQELKFWISFVSRSHDIKVLPTMSFGYDRSQNIFIGSFCTSLKLFMELVVFSYFLNSEQSCQVP